MNNQDDAAKRTITIERTFKAPIALVWEAWTQAEHIARWWGPKGMVMDVVEHDFKVGGNWKYTMPMPNGSEFVSEGQYSEITPMTKIVTSANFIPMTMGVELHISLEEQGENTHFTFSVVHPTEEYCKAQEKMGIYNGWGSAFDRLEASLTNAQ
ncbi:MAG: SRPBCC domain-containing protein [Bacteroidia bacterium]